MLLLKQVYPHVGVSPCPVLLWFCFFFFFPLRVPHRFEVEETALDKLKITFENSTDFFGRIVVYHLRVLGERL